MTVFAGQGDPTRSMALLWGTDTPPAPGPRKTPGPKRALNLQTIVEAAIAAADANPTAEVSLRAVADRLGCTSMALYTYVPGKAELLDLMYDRAHAELPTHHPQGEWRAAAAAWARELRAFYLRHPWVLQVSHARPVMGPHEQAVLETLAGILLRTGLPAATLRGVTAALFHLVRGNAQTAAEARLAAAATGVPDRQWWAGRSALLQRLAPDFTERFPMSARLATPHPAPARDDTTPYLEDRAEEVFTTGLAVLLEGVQATAATPPAPPS
ncbi:TetR family transcriptional regulator [Streptosporangium violaceochromogenes]|nr:TetR family transcriptional regulator [Streptosporangium violaceochromogenes]